MEEGSNQVLEKEANKLSSLKRDVGGMGWRLGRLLTKMHKDRYGPKVREDLMAHILKMILKEFCVAFI